MQSEFNFLQQWYPLSPLADLDPNRPTPVTLLGLRLVIWKPKSSQTYSVFLDQCPHRLAPLSEGRVDEKTGNLMCSYHGWQFDAQGICTHIPQAEDPELVTKNQQNFCVVSLPVRQENDLLWVWADAKSTELAATTPLPLSPLIDASKGFVWDSYVQGWKTAYKLPTSADRLVIEFRNWFDKYCHGQLPWSEVGIILPPSPTINDNRSVMLDRYKQHTQHCSSCRGALKNIQRSQVILLAYFVTALSVVAILPDGLRIKLGLPLMITAIFSLGVYTWLKFWLVPKFYFVDYIHAQR